MTPEQFAALTGPAGADALHAATALADRDPLAAAAALRGQGVPPDLAASALSQVELRLRARAKFGADAAVMFFTRAGLEQATRAPVATARAARLAAAGVTRLADLGCGIGADTVAMARAGIRVRAVDADPLTAAVAAANVRALGLADRVGVDHATAESVDLSTVDAVFCDPARRTGRGRVFDPDAFRPPWSFLTGLLAAVPRTVLKLAPGIEHRLIPPGAEAHWVSVAGDVVEAAFWCGPLAEVPRRASLYDPDGHRCELTGRGTRDVPTGPVRGIVYDPDGAVLRSRLLAEFADTVDGTLADPEIGYLYADRFTPSPFGRGYRVEEVLPFSVKRLRQRLRELGVGRVTIKKRGSAVLPEELRRHLRLAGPAERTVVLTRVAGTPTALLATPVTA